VKDEDLKTHEQLREWAKGDRLASPPPEDLLAEWDAAQRHFVALKTNLEESFRQREHTRSLCDELRTTVANVTTKNSALHNECVILEQKYEGECKRAEELTHELCAASDRVKALEERVHETEREYGAALIAIASLRADLKEAEKENADLTKRADPLDFERQTHDVQISSLTNDRDEAREKVKTLEAENARLQRAMEAKHEAWLREEGYRDEAVKEAKEINDKLNDLRAALRVIAGVC
jgi:chromosome segregation ATPase